MEVVRKASADAQVEKNDLGIIKIDHVTLCVNSLQGTQDFFKQVMGFGEFAYFKPATNVSGMISTVVKLGDIKVAVNEGTNPDSQIVDFVNKHGEGVQHIAWLVKDLDAAVAILKTRGVEFLTEVLHDSDEFGTLKQIFTKPLFGGMFFEFIQRDGCQGFGQGNVQRLYEAVEEAQFKGQGKPRK